MSCHRLGTNAGHRFICRNTRFGATGRQLLKCQWRLLSSCGKLKLVREEMEKEGTKGRRRPWGCYLFCGSRCQWKISVRSTSAVRTFGAGTVTNISDKCFSTDSSRWVICLRQANTHPVLPIFLKYLPLPSLILPELHSRVRGSLVCAICYPCNIYTSKSE